MLIQFLPSLHLFTGFLVFGTIPFSTVQTLECYPPASKAEQQFIIGYGSLMQKESKERTYPNTGESIPVRIDGFERSWTCRGETVGFSTTFLGVENSLNKSACINAVYFKINSVEALHSYDARGSFYCREEVVQSKIHLMTKHDIQKGLHTGQYWIYVTRPEFRKTATVDYPIVQSYVDTFIIGCLELEKNHKLSEFAEECVQTTGSWESPWVNDRIFPRRPFVWQKMAGEIDGLLNRTVHDAYKKIKIKGGFNQEPVNHQVTSTTEVSETSTTTEVSETSTTTEVSETNTTTEVPEISSTTEKRFTSTTQIPDTSPTPEIQFSSTTTKKLEISTTPKVLLHRQEKSYEVTKKPRKLQKGLKPKTMNYAFN